MAKDKETKDENRGAMHVGLTWSWTDVKLLLISLLFLCSLVTLFQLFPSGRLAIFSAADLRSCISSKLAQPQTAIVIPTQHLPTPSPPPIAPHPLIQVSNGPIIKRAFTAIGTAAYLFVHMGAYRGGLDNFAVVGLGSKPLHVYAKPRFQCEWIAHNGSIFGKAYKILPDWGYGRVYTVVVVNCTFPVAVGGDGTGGTLVLHATTGGGGDREVDLKERIVALEETPGSMNATLFTSPPKYDYLYCGSSLYGNLSPQRVREWVAYHAKLFGERSHFVIHDAGGAHEGVREVLRPWIEKGVVTLQDIRDQERFDGYYHNQFLVVNDCLHRYRFDAKWMFFFDVDEFIYLQPKTTLASLVRDLSGYTQFTIEQVPMSGKICHSSDAGKAPGMWGFEKLVYRDVKRGLRRDRKYAIQPRSVFATGVHMSQNVAGRTLHKTERRITYYHFHGTIAERREACRVFANSTEVVVDGTPYVMDDTLRKLAGSVKVFEQKTIGSSLRRTRQ